MGANANTSVWTGQAVSMARTALKREKETQLRDDLREMRDAIDSYKDASDRLLLREKGDDTGYPKSLDIIVKGVEINGGKTVRFLREIPVEPMTGEAEWGMQSIEDDPGFDSWRETVMFDVYSKAD